jgi:hypothetical protein
MGWSAGPVALSCSCHFPCIMPNRNYSFVLCALAISVTVLLLLLLLLQVVAFGEGHASWVSRVAFDPWLCTTNSSGGPGETAAALPATPLRSRCIVFCSCRRQCRIVCSQGSACACLLRV